MAQYEPQYITENGKEFRFFMADKIERAADSFNPIKDILADMVESVIKKDYIMEKAYFVLYVRADQYALASRIVDGPNVGTC